MKDCTQQLNIFDGLTLDNIKNPQVKPIAKKFYHLCLLELTKMLINDKLTVDEYKQYLHTLCENYRKEYK